MTPFETKCGILGDVWLSFRNDEGWEDLIAYNDLGFPLGYAIDTGIVEATDTAKVFIEETFQNLLDFLEIEDTGFTSIEEMIQEVSE